MILFILLSVSGKTVCQESYIRAVFQPAYSSVVAIVVPLTSVFVEMNYCCVFKLIGDGNYFPHKIVNASESIHKKAATIYVDLCY